MDISNYNIEQCDAVSVLNAIMDMHDHPQKIDQIAAAISPIAAAAAAYSEGKPQLAQAITAKGVTTAADASLATMAANIRSIQQETITIDGGEMYAKQLYGVKDNSIVPGYWNLYEVIAYLLSKTSSEQYSILLCEIPKGDAEYTFGTAVTPGSIPMGYVFSDDWQLNGAGSLYIHDATEASHIWNDNLDMKGNRWVAWLFAQVVEGATAPTVSLGAAATNCPQPRSIHIGRHMGTITATANGVLSEIVVTDGNVLDDFLGGSYTQGYNKRLTVRNITSHSSGNLIYDSTAQYLYLQVKDIGVPGGVLTDGAHGTAVIIDLPETINIGTGSGRESNRICQSSAPTVIITGLKTLRGLRFSQNINVKNYIMKDLEDFGCGNGDMIRECTIDRLYFPGLESASGEGGYSSYTHFYLGTIKYIYLGYKDNDYQKSVVLTNRGTGISNLTDIELKDGYLKPLNVAALSTVLTAENIALHMLDRLGTCTAETGQLTLKIGATNLATIQNDSTYSSYLTEATTTKGWAVIA